MKEPNETSNVPETTSSAPNVGEESDKLEATSSINVPSERRRSVGMEFKNPNALTYSWEEMNVYAKVLPAEANKGCCKRRHYESKHILKNVTGIARPGELLAIMGSSGAGKSTLLNILTGRHVSNLKVTGRTLINGYPVDKSMLSSVSAFIQQTDVFIGTLTPREHLRFQAALRMDQSIPRKEKMEIVEQLIFDMGLTKCADTVIGIPGQIKGLSGGQQKRLSIASEVVTDPCILFCDEPTTGLDSFVSESVVKAMRDLARRGKTIICTIHQPASGTFALFDRLLLMSEGRVAFLGDVDDALMFFNDVGFPAPMNYNPADHYIFTLAIKTGEEEASRAKCTQICNTFANSVYQEDIIDGIRVKNEKSYNMVTSRHKEKKVSLYKASPWVQFRECYVRSVRTIFRDPIVLKIQFLKCIIVALFVGLTFLQQDPKELKSIQNINGFIFMAICDFTITSIFPVLNVFFSEIAVFRRERFNGTYRIGWYYFTKMLAEFPIYVINPAVYMTIGYWMVGLNSKPDRFFIAIGMSTLLANIGASIGYFIATISSSLDVAVSIAPVFITPFILCGGIFIKKHSIHDGFSMFKWPSWYLHSFEILAVNQWKGVQNFTVEFPKKCFNFTMNISVPVPAPTTLSYIATTIPPLYNETSVITALSSISGVSENITESNGTTIQMPATPLFRKVTRTICSNNKTTNGTDILNNYDFSENSVILAISILITTLVVLRIVALVILLIKTRKEE